MKKILGILALALVTLSMVGCDIAGDGDKYEKQRLSSADTVRSLSA